MELTIQDLHVLINVSNKEGGSVQGCWEEAAEHYRSSRELHSGVGGALEGVRRACLPVSVCEHGARAPAWVSPGGERESLSTKK